jgi:hypothetical protein
MKSSTIITLLFCLSQISIAQVNITFEVKALTLDSTNKLGIRGDQPPLSWEKTIYLEPHEVVNTFITSIDFDSERPFFEYKYVIEDLKGEVIYELDGQENRLAFLSDNKTMVIEDQWDVQPVYYISDLPSLPAEYLQEDADILGQALWQLHPGVERYLDSAAFFVNLEDLKQTFNQPMSYTETFRHLSTFVATLRCGHTYANPYNQSGFIKKILLSQPDKLPFGLVWIDKRLFITKNATGDPAFNRGAEILSINGVPIKEFADQLLPMVKGDGSNEAVRYEQLNVVGYDAYELFDIYFPLVGLLLGRIFDQIGFNQIDSYLFKPLVLSRLESPSSKLKTTDYLAKYYALQIDVESIYRYMDTLYNTQKEAVQQISYQHTKQILGDEIRMVFYDVTTLYFEIEKEDTLRKTGFSKDGKHQNPQIVLGLLVSANAYPLAYDIFEGNKYEGDTMLPIIDSFRLKYSFETLTIVADSGLISERNIQDLEERGYKYILGARIKNQPRSIEEQIHALDLRDGECQIIWKDPGTALVISFSARRARKDYFNRERGLKRLEKQIISGKLTKSSINKRGYNKYLKLEGEMDISIDREKFDADGKWDGLKGYQTNDKSLSGQQVMDSYRQLWKIEKAFRISKHKMPLVILHSIEALKSFRSMECR